MSYELWREDSMNLQGSWRTEAEAREGVRALLARKRQSVDKYALARVDANGTYHTIAAGQALKGWADPPAGRHRRAAA